MGESSEAERREQPVPVVLEDGAVEYLPGTTEVTWLGTSYTLESFGRSLDTNAHRDAAVVLPDARRGQIEGWKDEALRLRAEAARRQRLFMRQAEPTFGPFDKGADGMVSLPFQDNSGVAAFIFGAMAGLLEGKNGGVFAQNYVAMAGWHPVVGHLECVIQRVGKLTPQRAREEAERHLGRAVALLAKHGIAWDGPTEFPPDAPPDRGVPADREHPWLTIDPTRYPNEMACARCGTRQPMPERGTADVFEGMIQVFVAKHGDCEEGDAERLGLSGGADADGTESAL